MDVETLIAKQAIHDVVMRYCRGIDRMDRELVRGCYHPDGTDDHGSFSGTVDEFLEWVFRLLAKYEHTMHFVGNVHAEVRGDRAICESYGIAFHRAQDPAPHLNLITGFRYLDRFEQRAGDWRIAARTAVTEWASQEEPAQRWEIPAGLRTGRRDTSDAYYALLRELDRET